MLQWIFLRRISPLEVACGKKWRVRQVGYGVLAYSDNKGREMLIEADAWSNKIVLLGSTWKWTPGGEESTPTERFNVIKRTRQALHKLNCPNVDIEPAMQSAGLQPAKPSDLGSADEVDAQTIRAELDGRFVTARWSLNGDIVVVKLSDVARFDPPHDGQTLTPVELARLMTVVTRWATGRGYTVMYTKAE